MNKTIATALTALWLAAGGPASAATLKCGTGNFDAWLQDFRAEAAQAGISSRTIARALDGIGYDPDVIRRDNAQGVFSQTFLQFSGRMVSNNRLQTGAALIRKYRDTFRAIEQQFGVPAEVLTAYWGLETDFGKVLGNSSTLRSLATMAYDCRRSEMFQTELMDALKLIDRGDLDPSEMHGPWAGEMGQLQFLPSRYLEFGIDMDNDGRVQLLTSSPDALASAAKYIQSLGWQRGEPWLVEVRVPESMPWAEADATIRHPVTQWAKWGVRRADGSPLSGPGEASLILPMGKDGPAFLAYPNFTNVYLEWNNSLIYSLTAGYFATRLAGAPRVSEGRGAVGLEFSEVKELQKLLAKRGFDVGKIDGVLGAKSRDGIKAMQKKFGLAEDGYPTPELLDRMRGNG
jgi:lytic murein transglycosylase